MTDPRNDRNPDSPPRDYERGSVESLDRPAEDAASPDPGNGAVGGTDGVTRNQDDGAQ